MDNPISPERPVAERWAYFLTFACYGMRLHGDSRGSVDREHNAYRGRYVPENERRVRHEYRLMNGQPVTLSEAERRTVLDELRRTCAHHDWVLHAAHVRSTHVHAVVTAPVEPQYILRDLKAYASRALNQCFGFKPKRWARHGSRIPLWNPHRLDRTVDYVVRGQGHPMALYVNPNRWPEYLDLP